MFFVTAVLLILNSTGARAESVAGSVGDKATFEQLTQVLVWDEGGADGRVDQGDFLVDLTKACSSERLDLNRLAPIVLANPESIKREADQMLAAIGITSPLRMNVVASSLGKAAGPVVLIFPEIHLRNESNAKTRLLHERGGLDVLALTEDLLARGTVVVNSQEGPFGRPHVQTWPLPGDSRAARYAFALDQQSKRWMSGAYLVAEAFGPRLPYLTNDDNDLFLRNVLATSLDNDPDARPTFRGLWPRARAWLRTEHPERFAESSGRVLRSYLKHVLTLPPGGIKKESERLCERRSVVMAERTLEAVRLRGAAVALISVGALHAHGVMETLRARGVSYVVFSRNF